MENYHGTTIVSVRRRLPDAVLVVDAIFAVSESGLDLQTVEVTLV